MCVIYVVEFVNWNQYIELVCEIRVELVIMVEFVNYVVEFGKEMCVIYVVEFVNWNQYVELVCELNQG